MCSNVLYDVTNTNTTASNSSNDSHWYWKTSITKKGKFIKEGYKVIRLLKNFDVFGLYVNKAQTQNPPNTDFGKKALENAMVEMERLTCLDDQNDCQRHK